MQKYSKSAIVVALAYMSILVSNVSGGMQKTTMAADQISTNHTKTVQLHKKQTAPEGANKVKPMKADDTNSHSSFSQVSTYWKSDGDSKAQLSKREMSVFEKPSTSSKLVTKVLADQNFSVEQGDWVKIKTDAGKEGWALVKDVEQNINDAWNGQYQVIINGPASKYSVTKISPEERLKRQSAMHKRQRERMKKLSQLWEDEFFVFNDQKDTEAELKDLKGQVLSLSEKIKGIEQQKKKA